ncbi:MAG TPA: hypothetical protein VF600_17905 [Abditibacteriaceae bacterium]|jgi:hypothetical protein
MCSLEITPRKLIHRHFIMGNDSRRSMYESSRRALMRGTVATHERLAHEYSDKAGFEIPRERGFVSMAPGTFAEIDGVVEDVRRRIAGYSEDELMGPKKSQLRNRLLPGKELTLDSPYLRFALREDVLAAIGNYLGAAPLLSDVDVWYSLHRGGELANSQLHHCDWDAVTQMKIFVYANDVDQSTGPLTLIDAENSRRLREKLGYVYGYANIKKLSDEQIGKVMGEATEYSMTGDAGTSIFADTSSCFHYGSRSEKPRLMAFFQYFAPTAFKLSKRYAKNLPFRHLAGESSLSPLQRLALNGTS